MSDGPSFLENPQGTQEEIMQATFLALCEYGYADLTIQRIGEHFEKSMSLIYQHYEGKDELLLEFLSFMLEEFDRSMPSISDDDPSTHLETILDHAFSTEPPIDRQQLESAIIELRAQAIHDERYYDQFSRHDRFFQERLREVIQAGIADGTFRDVDPEIVVSFIFTVLEGVRTLRVTSDTNVIEAAHAGVEASLKNILYAE